MSKFKPFLFGSILLIIDQLTKIFALKNEFATLNSDLALSLEAPFIIEVSILLLILLCFFLYKYKINSLGLIIAGGISNLIDRLVFGGVVDFIKILNLPIFNIADIYIVIGIIFVIFSLFKNVTNEYRE